MACNEGRHVKATAPECNKLDCWCFPEPYVKQPVKVLKKKYCWLYPQNEVKKLKKLLPNFDECKTLYTKCDYKIESCVHARLLRIERLCRQHNDIANLEIRFQRKLIDDMWKQSQRFIILTQGAMHVNLYPVVASEDAERRALCEFQRKVKALNLSNCRIGSSLELIKEAIKEMNRCCEMLDMTVESPYLVGDTSIRPLAYYRELIADLYDYFFRVLGKLKSWAQLLDIGDIDSITDYKGLLNTTNFNDMMELGNEANCGCMRNQIRNCIDDFENECSDGNLSLK